MSIQFKEFENLTSSNQILQEPDKGFSCIIHFMSSTSFHIEYESLTELSVSQLCHNIINEIIQNNEIGVKIIDIEADEELNPLTELSKSDDFTPIPQYNVIAYDISIIRRFQKYIEDIIDVQGNDSTFYQNALKWISEYRTCKKLYINIFTKDDDEEMEKDNDLINEFLIFVLKYCPLTNYLHLSDITLKPEFFECLKNNKTIEGITYVSYFNGPIGSPNFHSFIDVLSNNNTIKYIDLPEAYLSDEKIDILCKCLEPNTSVTYLNLESNAITLNGINSLTELLQKNPNIKHLNLTRNEFNHLCIERLSQGIQNLESLDLSYTHLNDNSLIHISNVLNNTNISRLDIKFNHLSPNGILPLCESLKTNNKLKYINLEINGISDEGAQHLANALSINNSITELHIRNCCITPEGIELIKNSINHRTDEVIIKAEVSVGDLLYGDGDDEDYEDDEDDEDD